MRRLPYEDGFGWNDAVSPNDIVWADAAAAASVTWTDVSGNRLGDYYITSDSILLIGVYSNSEV
jgi:hypothetical protein